MPSVSYVRSVDWVTVSE